MGRIRKGETFKGRFLKPLAAFFFVVFIICLLLFAQSYRELNRSIQDERVASVQQLGILISDKVSMLRDDYAEETQRLATILMNSDITDMEVLQRIFSGSGDILLVTDTGNFLSVDGSRWLVDDNELRRNVLEGTEVKSSFATVQTRGDYWLFSVGVEDVVIDGISIVGLVRLIDAQEYANVATIPLYGGLGASYVVDSDGHILMRPKTVGINNVFKGYNLFNILEREGVDPSGIEKLKAAVREGTEYQLVSKIQGSTWLLQSISGDPGHGIIITVPVSVTARETYSRMRNAIVLIALMILSLSILVLSSLVLLMKKNQQVELNQAKAKAKNDFLDKMSHDIRTPLNAIIGMHELALGSLDDREVLLDCLKKAKMSSEYLVSIINDVLDMSKIESGKMTISHRQFSMEELLNHVEQMELLPAGEKGLKFSLEIKTPINHDFIGDPVRIRQCLVNLISNALKFTPQGGTVRFLYESSAIDEEHALVIFTVSDTGIGMSEEFLSRIFNPFEQEYSSLTSTYVGSGLGLSIVNSLVTLMGGDIAVDSRLGQGSTFTLRIPMETAAKAEQSAAPEPEEEFLEQIRGKRVLFVEDNEINREIGSLTLERLGLLVETAENGKAAVEKVEGSPKGYYAIILMDIQMPVMNGLEAARCIRASACPDAGDIPIVALSANAFDEDSRRSLEAGMQAHLAKPIDLIELKQVLKKYIRVGENCHEK